MNRGFGKRNKQNFLEFKSVRKNCVQMSDSSEAEQKRVGVKRYDWREDLSKSRNLDESGQVSHFNISIEPRADADEHRD